MRKNTITLLLLLGTFLILSACSSKEVLVYEGEGDKWAVVYNAENKSDNSFDYEILFIYKGDVQDLKEFSEVTFEVDTGSSKVGGPVPTLLLNLDDKVVFKTGGSYEGVSLLSEDLIIKTNIKWGTYKESTILEMKD